MDADQILYVKKIFILFLSVPLIFCNLFLPTGLAMAACSSVYLSSLDRSSVVHQEDPSLWYLRGDVYRHLQHLPVLLSRLLSLHCRLCTRILFASAEPGKIKIYPLKA